MARRPSVTWLRLPGPRPCFGLRADTPLGTFVLRTERAPVCDTVRVILYPIRGNPHQLAFGAPVVGVFDSVSEAQRHVDHLVAAEDCS